MEFIVPGPERYSRHHLISWWDQDVLAKAKVLVAGAGAVGNEVVKLLSLMGLGNVYIVDFDKVEISNLTRTILFRAADIGRSKAEVAAERAAEINPDACINSLQGDLEFDLGLGVVRSMDAAISCLDSINARWALNAKCQRANVPMINTGISATSGEVSFFVPGNGACFECMMTSGMWKARNLRYSCGGLRSLASERKLPTTATVASVAAALAVNELLLFLHERDFTQKQGLKPSQRLFFSLKPYDWRIFDIQPSAGCPSHERLGEIVTVEESPAKATVESIADRFGGEVELPFELLLALRCTSCSREDTIRRALKRVPANEASCPYCGAPSRMKECASRITKGSGIERASLSDLGVAEHEIIKVVTPAGAVDVQLSGEFRFGRR